MDLGIGGKRSKRNNSPSLLEKIDMSIEQMRSQREKIETELKELQKLLFKMSTRNKRNKNQYCIVQL